MEKLSGVLWRWAGSKFRIRDEVLEHVDRHKPTCSLTAPRELSSCGCFRQPKFKRFIAPFCGGCSVELEAMRRGLAESYVLGDALPEIQATLQIIKSDLDGLLFELQRFAALPVEQQRVQFLEYRAPYTGPFQCLKALRFMILQGCSFNGLWRQSKKTGYNVPFGRPASFDYATLRQAAKLLQEFQPQILCQDFTQTVALAGPGDLVYCDPPYLGTHSAYSTSGFDCSEHERLAVVLHWAKRQGAECWVSGSDVEHTRRIYGGEVFEIQARRSIGCKTASRGVQRELLIHV